MEQFDYGIIGGGPAGYTVAMFLAKQGKTVVLFEKDKLGGTCLNKGCIPTKSFLHSSELYANILSSEDIGVSYENLSLYFSKVIEKKDKTVDKVRKSLELAVKNSGVKTIYTEACVIDNNTILAGDDKYKAGKIIIATGAKPKEIKGLEFDGEFILSSDDILNIKELPKSVLIAGSGAIGTEWARILSNFGVNVSIVEMAEHLIPAADIDVSKRIERIFKQKKVNIFLKNSIAKIQNKTVILKTGEEITPDFVLVAAGREPICLECKQNTVLGDACGEIQLAHYAIHQAKEFALGVPFDKNLIPSIIYGTPEIAWVGLREQDCDETFRKTKIPVTALGKAWCDDSTEGFIKIITKNNQIFGAHIISKEASSLIHLVLIAIQNKLSIDDLKKICFAHPTYSEGIFDILINL